MVMPKKHHICTRAKDIPSAKNCATYAEVNGMHQINAYTYTEIAAAATIFASSRNGYM
jgi:hypothetical protein